MNELKIINEQKVLGKHFAVYGDFENPLFLAKDVASWIENKQPTQMVELVDDNEKLKCIINTSGQNREMWFLTEDGLYEVLMQSRKPIAKQFKHEVKKILKDIRRHGIYATDSVIDDMLSNPEFGIKLLSELKSERERRAAAELEAKKKDQIIGELKPKADYTDTILQNNGLVNTNQIAKDYGMSANTFNKTLADLRIQYKQGGQWLLYSKYQKKGYTSSETFEFIHKNGIRDVKMRTKWTQKGRLFLYNILKEHGIVPLIEKDQKTA